MASESGDNSAAKIDPVDTEAEMELEPTGLTSENSCFSNSILNDQQEIQIETSQRTESVVANSNNQLIDFLKYLEDYNPTIPDSITSHIMQTSGFNTDDSRILRLASLAGQKFIADIVNDALQHCKMRTAMNQNKKVLKDRRYILTFEDLVPVLSEYGINIKKPQYFF
ncbi:Transcription initiation factor TFIID subunit 10 [Sarcoptes scabiei]|uniref:Transcription initiation factor TFIID subunit 10 n=1 Tax=Sarcoptes scabiei TaxID=52283 RepID=A0A132A0Z9_SARSC|nr:Transcription initiation factor TFIID subunit 10 [Sarcoptes scabiei]KPM04748.1 transcription initiation factor TFIID subunit 10-like protein [Sarcoptes scabiei]UXI15128.1 E3 ubiquitin-protein ligase rififylin-like [Sarcoptes scabiei]